MSQPLTVPSKDFDAYAVRACRLPEQIDDCELDIDRLVADMRLDY
ncbi:LOW QUALITY PROTEIN: hypothetical protein TorRG33x02_324400 [Trema orientale]|uniref:Uncharacterized protein n=1 Tax=Trema orientale TaxID=63057 RepID=A0A2P5BE34_TREOI|nr:LOW QUALITY PROTEIN: hypothetical protein TorRG33x02_324400 [Trema orientale]